MRKRREKSWNFVESCGRKSPWCTPSLVRIGTHLVHFLMSRRQIFSIKSIKSSKLIINGTQCRNGERERERERERESGELRIYLSLTVLISFVTNIIAPYVATQHEWQLGPYNAARGNDLSSINGALGLWGASRPLWSIIQQGRILGTRRA